MYFCEDIFNVDILKLLVFSILFYFVFNVYTILESSCWKRDYEMFTDHIR